MLQLPPTVRAHRSLDYLAPCVLIMGLFFGAYAVQDTLEHARVAFLLDVGVFRDAGRAITENFPLYSSDFPTRSGFRFIYPPFAAALFVPLTWMTEERMQDVWTIATVVAVLAVVSMATHRLGLRRWWMWAIGLTGFALMLDPIQKHLMYGQINIFLALLITADVLGYMPRWLRGLGIGVAAGIKITPAAYALIFFVRRDWWSLVRSVFFALVTVGIGLLIRPSDAWYYWTVEFFNPDRGGAPSYPPNQALTGLIARLGIPDDTASTIMGPGFLILAALTFWGVWKLTWSGRHVDALMMVLLGISLANPIAVTHHWSGMVIALPLVFVAVNRYVGTAMLLFLYANFAGFWVLYPTQPTYSFEFPEWFVYNLQGLLGLNLFVTYLVTVPKPVGAPPLLPFRRHPAPHSTSPLREPQEGVVQPAG